MSWIEKNESILHNEVQEKIYMDEIDCIFIFIDTKGDIIKINKEAVDLEINKKENNSILRKDSLLNLIQTQKQSMTNMSFIYKHALSYLFEYDHQDVLFFIENDKDFEPSLKPLPLFEDIFIHSSIYIFHDLNCLYFFFEESGKQLKPILKIHDLKKFVPSKRVTIKVSKKSKAHTRKNNL